MAATVQPVIITADMSRLLAFYTELLGATQTSRVPDDGPAFYVGLRIGDSELGLVANAAPLLKGPFQSWKGPFTDRG